MQNAGTKLSIIMPVRNEGANIEVMLRMLGAVVEVPSEIIFVVDSPDDTTVPRVRSLKGRFANVKLVVNALGKGVLNAVRAGVANSASDIMLIFAVDEVGPVLAISDMLALMDQGCELVTATRYAYGGRRLGGSMLGQVLSRTANMLFNTLSGSALTDCTTGIKMFRREVFESLDLRSNPGGWSFAFEMSIKAQILGKRTGEVPIISVDRLYGGKSTFKFGPWVTAYLRWFAWGIFNLPKWKKVQKPLLRVPLTTTEG